MALDDIARIEQSLFYEPPRTRERLIRFGMLLLFSSVIATGGLISDSVASIIGAMIIAPLMTPIMGIVVATVIGSRSRVTRSAILVATGIVLAIAVGWLMATLMPTGWNPSESVQVMARTSPRFLDLIIALASGGAGAYALSRTDVADALPGVAIAISLVPPLNAAGILLAGAEYDLATGALLLFVTNFAAILFAGSVTFILTGLATGVGRSRRDLRKSLLTIVVMVVLVAIPLRANSQELWTDASHESDARAVIETWLAGTDYEIDSVNADKNELTILLAGSDEFPPYDQVLAELKQIMGEDLVLTARVVEVRREVIAD